MLIPLVLAFLSLALAYLLKRKNPLLRVNKNLVAGYLVALASLALSLSGFIPMANHDFSFVSAVGEEVGLSFPKEGHIKRETIEGNDAYSRSLVYFTNADEAEAFSAEVLQSSLWFSSSEELDPLLYQKDFYLGSRALYVDRYSLYNRTEKNINKTPAASGVYSLIEIEHIAATPYLAIFEYRLPYSAARSHAAE